MKPVKTAVIGCGAISDIYLSNMINRYAALDVLACCASHRESTEKKAAQYGIRPAATDEILADPEAVWQTLEPVSSLSDNCRGLGVADMARCLREGGTPRVSAELPCHVLDVIEKIIESGKSGLACATETVCDRPAAF